MTSTGQTHSKGEIILREMWLQSFLIHLITLLFLCLCSGFPACNAASSFRCGNETDRLALLAFKSKVTNDPLLTLSTWNESTHFCRWLGVTCGRRHRSVVALELDDRQLSGSISPHVGNLSFLRVLSLRNNSFTHIIPPEIGRLRRLKSLMLSNNSIGGEIPVNISAGCVNLVVLDLASNNLHGKILLEFGDGNSLSKLKLLGLHVNKLSGRLPPSLGNLSSLINFSVSVNYISGTIPDSLGQLKNLHVILLEGNRLTGTIPPSIFNLSSIRALSLQMNQIHGNLPSDMGNTLPLLEAIAIGANLFSGSIPVSLSNASKLQVLDLRGNKFVGKVPSLEKLHDLRALSLGMNQLGFGEADDLSFLSSLTNATYLRRLTADSNNLGGVLPGSIFNVSTKLESVLFGRNKIFGDIPVEIGSLVNLELLFLAENQFSGEIPSNFGNLQKLRDLSLGFNKLSGKIPLSLGNLTFLSRLDLAYNNFRGNIPPNLWKCQYLEGILLLQNSLEGRIPPQIFSLPSLWFLGLSHNRLSGSLPIEVGNLKILERMDISENLLSGEIPSTLGSCVTLRFLSMRHNNFRGIIPPSLGSLRGIEILDLSRNNLSGTIPNDFGRFVFLQNLNLSFNDFEGRVPKIGVFKNSTAISVTGNNKLCGGIPELQLPRCNFKTKKKKSPSLVRKLVTFVICGLLGSILVSGFGILFWSKKRCQEVSPFKMLGNPFLQVSYHDLLRATNGFSQANLIGVGSFGSVYKGILDQHGGKLVAVKVLNLQFQEALKSFKAECAVLKSIKHRNLVKVVTACSSIDHQGNDFKALVYEFMANGNLEKWLHPERNEDVEHGESEPMNFNLMLRLNIAIDVASALDYFHHHCPKPMAHCDLKPSNVLLDDEMTAHVGDFGMARLLPQARDDITATNQSSSIGLIGTVGYAPPEYGMGNEVSTSGDVYSYRIILLEMFTGKRPTDAMFNGTQNLHNYVKMALPEQITQIANSKLITPQGDQTEECLIALFGIGIACSEECPQDRMDIKDALSKLKTIRNNLGMAPVQGSNIPRIQL